MQKKILVTLLALCMLLAVLPFALTAGAATETGTTVRDCVHELADGKCSVCGATAISTPDELANLMADADGVSGDYYLVADIDMSKLSEGKTQASITSFSGVFDGNEKTISGLNTTYGLFAVATDAWIYDLTVAGTVGSDDATGVGGIVGNGTVTANQTLHIENCTNKCTITGKTYVGGIVGCIGTNSGSNANYGTVAIINCCNEGTISGTTQIGGVVGYTKTVGRVTITGCTNNGAVTASTDKDAGGILGCGWSTKSGTVGVLEASNCFNNGTIKGTTNVGGIVGRFYLEYVKAGCSASVVNCYNSGTVTSSTSATSVDAILANAASGSVYTNNYCNKGTTSTKGTAINGEFIEIMDKDTFLDLMSTENSDNWDADNCYILRIDIDLTDETQNPIGDSTTPFTGAFVGNSHVISGINITGTANYVGLFGYAKNAKFHDLTIEGSVTAGDYKYVGGLVGNGVCLTIENCTNKCSVSGVNYVGGIAGYLTKDDVSTVSGCLNTGAITCKKGYVGGVVAYACGVSSASHHTIQKCMNVGTVTEEGADRSDAGGILGIALNASAINCVNIGTVYGNGTCVGGILGRGNSSYAVSYCYNSGSVTCGGSENIGAIAGYAKSASVTKCYYSSGGTNANGTYVDIDDKANADTYTDWSADIWTFTSAGPRLTSYIVEIGTADEFIALTQNSDEWDDGNFYILTADIDLKSVEGQTSIGNATTPFVGGFDGAGHTISGIDIEGAVEKVGLFGVAENAEFYELTIDGDVGGDQKYTGGLVGYGSNLYIENCTNRCTVTANAEYVGGIAGYLPVSTRSIIIGSRNDGSITGSRYVGGIVGQAYSDDTDTSSDTAHEIIECMNTCTVESTSTKQGDIGGIVGVARGVYVTDCINTGAITAVSKYVGGIVGRTYELSSSSRSNSIKYCYNSGTVKGSSSAFVIVGSPGKGLADIASEIKLTNYYTADADANTKYAIYVATADLGDATQYSGLNANGKWLITDDGPRLRRFTVEISAEVVATTVDTVTVELYAESGVPFWGVKFAINAGEGLTLATEGFAVETVGGFECVPSENGTTAALSKMSVADSALAKTKIATLTFNVAEDATAIQDITVTVDEAYNSKDDVVDAYGDSTSISTILLDVTYGHGVVLYSEYVLEYTLNPGKYSWLEALKAENCYMLFESTDANGKTTATVVDAYEQSGKFRFSAPGIAAKNMGDEVKGTLFFVDEDGNRHYGFTDTYNIIDYCNKMTGKGYGEVFDALLNSMLVYGAAAQTFFDYNTDALVSNGTPADVSVSDPKNELEGDYAYGWATMSANLEQRIEPVWVFTLNEGKTAVDASSTLVFKGTYTDAKGNERSFEISGDKIEVGDTTVTVYIDQIAAKDLREVIEGTLYTVAEGGTETQVSTTVQNSFDFYAAYVLNTEDISSMTSDPDGLKALCKAIIAYSNAAKTYFTQPN